MCYAARVSRAMLGDRSLFPDLWARAYCNHAAISPPSTAVRAAVDELLGDYAERGVSAFPRWHEQRHRLRGKLARLVGGAADDIGLVLSTTAGVVIVALCFPWRAGDRVIVFEGEFPANVTPWQRAAELFGLEVVMLRVADFEGDGARGLDALEQALRRGARLVAASAVQFQSGLRMPLGEIARLAHAHGAELFVDAVQACGVVPIDVAALGIDYLACGSHKWLMGVEGSGLLWIHPERIGALRPAVAGWLSHENPVAFLVEGPGKLRYDRPIRRRADFVEAGNVNAMGFAALEASVDRLLDLGIETIAGHVAAYLDELEPALVARGFTSLRSPVPARRSGILAALPPAGVSVVDLHRELGARGVSCSIPDGRLRFSPHWPNSRSEIPFVVEAVDDALRTLSRAR